MHICKLLAKKSISDFAKLNNYAVNYIIALQRSKWSTRAECFAISSYNKYAQSYLDTDFYKYNLISLVWIPGSRELHSASFCATLYVNYNNTASQKTAQLPETKQTQLTLLLPNTRCYIKTSKLAGFPISWLILFRDFISIRENIVSIIPRFRRAADGVRFSTDVV